MAEHLAYWKSFWNWGPKRARDHCLKKGFGSDQVDILDKFEVGDTLWVVGRSEDDIAWRLLQRLHVGKNYTDAEGMHRVLAVRQVSFTIR